MNTLQEELRAPLFSSLDYEVMSEAADRIDALEAENAQLRELLNAYNLGGWTDAERLMKERDAARAENAALLAVLKKARNEVAYMASGMTHAAWKTEQAQQVLTAIDAAIARSKT